MALVLKYVNDFHTIMNKNGDPRTVNWMFMSSPFYTLGLCISYVYIAKVLGPKLMESRQPFELRKILIAYNLFQVTFSTWIFYELSMSGWLTGRYSWRCQPVDYSSHPDTLRMINASWWFYFSKLTDLMDTVFFILRKKYSQVTTLHVIHHGMMPMSVWLCVKFTPAGHSTFAGFLNSLVHIVMYTYYLLAASGPQMQKYLWWKKYLTTIQIVQFVLIMVHAFQLLFIDCNYPRVFVWFVGMQAVMFFFLFKDFYNQVYGTRLKKKVQATENDHSNDHFSHNECKDEFAMENVHISKQNAAKDAVDYYSDVQFWKLAQRTKFQ